MRTSDEVRRNTVYCGTHGILEPAVIDRATGAHPVLYSPERVPPGTIIARAVLACGEAHMVVTLR